MRDPGARPAGEARRLARVCLAAATRGLARGAGVRGAASETAQALAAR